MCKGLLRFLSFLINLLFYWIEEFHFFVMNSWLWKSRGDPYRLALFKHVTKTLHRICANPIQFFKDNSKMKNEDDGNTHHSQTLHQRFCETFPIHCYGNTWYLENKLVDIPRKHLATMNFFSPLGFEQHMVFNFCLVLFSHLAK